MIVIDVLAPIVLLIALGAILRANGFLPAGFFREANRLVFWIGIPSLLFRSLATAKPQLDAAAGILGVLLAVTATCIVLGYGVGRLLRLPRSSLASFVQGSYRGNLVYVGLPVVLYTLAAVGQDTPEREAVALLAIAPMVPVYNIVAVLLLIGARPASDVGYIRQAGKLLWGMATNPLVVACLAGLAYAYLDLPLPTAVDRSLAVLGQMALPLALLSIGASLRVWAIREGGWAATSASLIKVVLAPVAGFLIARWLGLGDTMLLITLLYLTMPTAVMSYVMAERMGADGPLAGSIVVLSTLLAMPTLAIVLVATTQ